MFTSSSAIWSVWTRLLHNHVLVASPSIPPPPFSHKGHGHCFIYTCMLWCWWIGAAWSQQLHKRANSRALTLKRFKLITMFTYTLENFIAFQIRKLGRTERLPTDSLGPLQGFCVCSLGAQQCGNSDRSQIEFPDTLSKRFARTCVHTHTLTIGC